MDLARLDRAYRTFVRCHEVIVGSSTQDELLDAVCRVAVNELGFRLAWIGLLKRGDERIRPVAHAGYDDGYVDSVVIRLSDDDPLSHGPTGRAVRDRAPAISRDIANDPRFAPWREDALQRGYASSAAIPLCDGARCVGVINLYAAEPDAFDDDEVALLEEMATDLLLGLRSIHNVHLLEELAKGADRLQTAAVVVSTVAHDVGNNLYAVGLNIESARRAASPQLREQALDNASQATQSAMTMLRQLNALSRRSLVATDRSDVDRVLLGVRWLLLRLAQHSTLTLTPGATGAESSISSIDLERILINLVVNASHAAGAHGTVLVSTRCLSIANQIVTTLRGQLPSGEYVEISVTDDGQGIAPAVLPHIFEPFFSTKGDVGTGLGLFSVLHLVNAAGGDVAVETALGGGTRFTVYLPRMATAEALPSWP